jgi:hypothetical protein
MHQLYESSASDRVATLGSAMHQLILSFLSARELAGVSSCSRTWYRASSADHLWSALSERELMREMMQSELADVVRNIEQEAEALCNPHPTALAVPPPPPADSRRSWAEVIQRHELGVNRHVALIGLAWHANLVGRASRLETEREYLKRAQQLQECVHKLHAYVRYVKKAEQHAAQLLQLRANAKARSEPAPFALALSIVSDSRHDAVSALLLASCALVQACHRDCGGVAPTERRPNPPAGQRSSAVATAATGTAAETATGASSSSSSTAASSASSSSSSSMSTPSLRTEDAEPHSRAIG